MPSIQPNCSSFFPSIVKMDHEHMYDGNLLFAYNMVLNVREIEMKMAENNFKPNKHGTENSYKIIVKIQFIIS